MNFSAFRMSSSQRAGLVLPQNFPIAVAILPALYLGGLGNLNENICFPFENWIDTDEDQDPEDTSFLSFFLFCCDFDS